jgi:hypothetical protein
MEAEGVSSYSQEAAACPYPEPNPFRPCLPIQPLRDPS